MKTFEAEREVTTGEIAESGTFSILATGKAFKILIDGLYSNKIKAVIRELWTNAYDSHSDAGNLDQPFNCTLPSQLEPHFSVRDFGVSMTHDTIMNLYTQLFNSTKTESNSVVGEKGLGSKSPFAYTDSFSVISYLDGVKRSYTAYIAEKGIPFIALMAEEETDEPNGLEVSFPVETKDIQSFLSTAEEVAKGFDVKPIIKGFSGSKFDSEVKEVLRSGEGSV